MAYDRERDIKYQELRSLINNKYNMLDLVRKYIPNATETEQRMPSFVIDYGDSSSMVVDYKEGKWKCYASGKGGGYLELLYWTMKNREGYTDSIVYLADKLLRNDKEMQKIIGLRTIFASKEVEKVDVQLRGGKPRRQVQSINKSIRQITRELASLDDKSAYIDIISDYELGLTEDELRMKYSNAKEGVITKDEKTELEELLKSIL